MPDLPIDTLFIVGLLIASFVGKILEGKANKSKQGKKSKRPNAEKQRSETKNERPVEK